MGGSPRRGPHGAQRLGPKAEEQRAVRRTLWRDRREQPPTVWEGKNAARADTGGCQYRPVAWVQLGCGTASSRLRPTMGPLVMMSSRQPEALASRFPPSM